MGETLANKETMNLRVSRGFLFTSQEVRIFDEITLGVS